MSARAELIRLIGDLEADGYVVSDVQTNTSEAVPTKEITVEFTQQEHQ